MGAAARGPNDYYASGDWNAICYECGRKFKASQLKRHWQGYYVCTKHWEPRQPQDFVRGVQDVQTPPWAQPMPAPQPAGASTVLWVNDKVYIADALAIKRVGTIHLSDLIAVSDSAGRSVSVQASDTVSITDSATVNTPNHRTVAVDDVVSVVDSATMSTPAHYVQNVADTVSITDSALMTTPQHYTVGASDYVTPSDTATVSLLPAGVNPINGRAIDAGPIN